LHGGLTFIMDAVRTM